MDDSDVTTALRLGWEMAEARGRSWPHGPRQESSKAMKLSEDLLPLRFQRDQQSSRAQTISTLVAQASRLRIPNAAGLPDTLRSDDEVVSEADWPSLAAAFVSADSDIQDELSQRDDGLANAYLLGRGLSECYWGLGPEAEWGTTKEPTGVSLAYLFGDDRRRELTRMLGRLKTADVDELSASAISGSLEAWGDVARDPRWSEGRPEELRAKLYEQVRRWYQLLVLGQDPTTMIKPSARLNNRYYLVKTLQAFWLQGVLAVVALGLTSTFFLTLTADFFEKVKPLLATGGVSAFAAAGLLTKGQSAAQRMQTRLRQDAYTDLVSVSVTEVPPYLEAGQKGKRARRLADGRVEQAVRKRMLTPPTPPNVT
jgi:hypothetical protein